MTTVPKRRRKKEIAPPLPPTCAYHMPGQARCAAHVEAFGHCHEHIRFSPADRAIVDTLMSRIHEARTEMEDLGNFILRTYVVFSGAPIPEDTARDYRNKYYRYTYLTGVRDHRRPGEPLPVEVTARAPQ